MTEIPAMEDYSVKLPYGSRFGFRTPPPEFAQNAIEPLSPIAGSTIPKDAPYAPLPLFQSSPFNSNPASNGRTLYNHPTGMSASAHTFPSPPLYSAEASTNPMLAFADIALAYTPTIFSTPRTSTFATAPIASTVASYSPPTSSLEPISSAVNLPNGAPNGGPSHQLSEAPSTSYKPRPIPPFDHPTVSVGQSPKRTSKRTRRKKAGDDSTRDEVAVRGTPKSTRNDRGRGRGRPSSNIRWVNSSPASEHRPAPLQTYPLAQYFPPPEEAEPPSPSPAYSPYPSRPSTPVTVPQCTTTFTGSTVARDSDALEVYPELHSGIKMGTVDGPAQPTTEHQALALGQETRRPTPGSTVERRLWTEELSDRLSPRKIDSVSTEVSSDTVPLSAHLVRASLAVDFSTVSQRSIGESIEPTVGMTATEELDDQHAPAALEALAASNVNAISLPVSAPEAPQNNSAVLNKREQSPGGGLMDMKDVENVALLSDQREADVPQGNEADKMDITEDIGESDKMMIDTDPTAPPSVVRDKSGLILPSLAGGDAGTQSLEAGVASEGQPMRLSEHNSMILVSDTLEEPRAIREGSVDYEVENAYQAGDEPVFGAGDAVEVGIPPEAISPEGPAAGVSAGVSESTTPKPEQDKTDGAEYQQLRVLSPTGESPREPENPSDEKCETCLGPYQDGHGFRFDQIAWIGCDGCGTWHHSRCVGLDSEMVNKIDKFYCSRCAEVHGPSTMKRKSNRATTAIDYNALHNGSSAPIKNPVDGKLHPYVEIIRNRTFTFADDKLPRMRPEQVTVEFLEDLPNGWNQPFIVPAESNPAPWVTPPKATILDLDDSTMPQTSSEEHSSRLATPPPPPLATCDGSAVDGSATPIPAPPSKAESRLPEMTLDNGDFDPAEVDRLKQTLREGEYDVKQRRLGADNLDMIIPPGLTVRRVSELIGESARVEMINVLSQATEKDDKWQMEQLVNYFESDVRDVIYNCISCEVSNSELGTMISRPQVVRDLDLADKVWRPDPAPLAGSEAKPRVGKYILMSVADSFTDFHIDFAGSSVFYHIYEGEKVFLVIPPTEHNLEIYEKWSMDPNMNTTFFPTLISDPCTLVTLNKGDTMFIPSGWIHAVYTPRDSLVVGGNFLTRNHYAMQMKVQRIEVVTDTKLSQRYPKYTTLMWHLAYSYMTKDPISDEVDEALGRGRVLKWTKQRSTKTARTYTQQELEGLPALCNFLLRTALVSCGTITTSLVPRRPNLTAKQIEAVKKAIPTPISHEPVEWIKRFGRWCVWKRACQRLVPNGERVPEWALESWWPKDGPKKGPSRAALRRAQKAREEEARKAEPPRRPGLRVRAIRAESTISSESEVWQEEGGASKPRPKKRANGPEAPPGTRKRGRPPNKPQPQPQPQPTFEDGDHFLIGKRKATMVEGEDGEAFTLSDGCTYVRKLSNLGPPRAGCQNCRLKKTGCKHKNEIAQLLTRLEASDKAAKAARGEQEDQRVEPVLAPAPMEDIGHKEMAEIQVIVSKPAKEKKTPTPKAKTPTPALKRALPEDSNESMEGVEVTSQPPLKKKKRVVVQVEREESSNPSTQNMAGGRPPGFQGRKPSCDRCKELKARCPHDTWHLAVERQTTRAQKVDKSKNHKKGGSGGRLSLGKLAKSSWDGARQTPVQRRHSSVGNTSTIVHEKTPEPEETESVLEEIIVVSSKPPLSRPPAPEVHIIKSPTKTTSPPAEKNSLELDLSILEEPISYKSRVSHTPEDPSIMAPPLDDLGEPSKPANPSSPSPPPTTTTSTTAPSITLLSTSMTASSSFAAPETLTPPTDPAPSINGITATTTATTTTTTAATTATTTSATPPAASTAATPPAATTATTPPAATTATTPPAATTATTPPAATTATTTAATSATTSATAATTTAPTTASTTSTTTSMTSIGRKADYSRLTHRAPRPKVTYTKSTKTVKRKEDEDRISPPATTKLAKSLSPGLTSGGRSGSRGSRKSVSPVLAEEDLQVEEIKRMAAKEEFGLRVRRSS